MMHTWQLQEAKNRLSEVVAEAITSGPQIISKRGVETVVVISFRDYRKLAGRQQKLTDFFQASPLYGVELDLSRDQGSPRPDLVL
jgi:prevent-host-death family protein